MFTCDKITNRTDGIKDMIEIELKYSKQCQKMSVVLRSCKNGGELLLFVEKSSNLLTTISGFGETPL